MHERQYHLFVISQDMEHFQHIHPRELADGTWTIDVTLPKPGYYKVLSDLMPSGGSSQFIARPLVTAGYTGDLAAASAHLVPDTTPTKIDGDITATVTYDPPQFVVGQYGHLTYHLTDTATGRPITDLQTYLGAFGHTLIMSEDMAEYVHSHPLDIIASPDDDGGAPVFLIPPGADLEKLRGGPGRDVRRPDAEAGPLSRLDAVPARQQDPHGCAHVRRRGAAMTRTRVRCCLRRLRLWRCCRGRRRPSPTKPSRRRCCSSGRS